MRSYRTKLGIIILFLRDIVILFLIVAFNGRGRTAACSGAISSGPGTARRRSVCKASWRVFPLRGKEWDAYRKLINDPRITRIGSFIQTPENRILFFL